MNVHVYDTHVTANNGKYYHFDIIVDDANEKHVNKYVEEYLASINITEKTIVKNECNFCHNQVATPSIIKDIKTKGHYILLLEGCPQN